VLDSLVSGEFSRGDRELFRPLVDNLIQSDPFFLLADYRAYVEAQAKVETLWRDPERWTRAVILNVARMGGFSSDRSINDYAREIWEVVPVPVPIPAR
jgi:glycogen phosphorylase